MRIVGGKFRGRRLAEPKSHTIRPTTDRNRESLFNILRHRWPEKLQGTSVLDLFAGTGALGLEALSRGAGRVTFVERGAEGLSIIRDNIKALGVGGVATVLRGDATKPGLFPHTGPFDLVIADPPYGKGLGEQAIMALHESGQLVEGALVILEEQRNGLPPTLAGFDKIDERRFSETAIGFFELLARP